MSIYYLVIGVIVFLVVAGIYAMRMLKGNSEDQAAVPISDVQEINELKKAYTAQPQKEKNESSSNITSHFINENIRKKEDAQALEQSNSPQELSEKIISLQRDLEFLKQRSTQKTAEIDKLKQENAQLNTALQREVSSKDAVTLSEEEKRDLEGKDGQLQRFGSANESLTKENANLQSQIEQARKANRELQKELEAAKIIQEVIPKEDEIPQIEKLQKDLQIIQQENQKLIQEKNTIGNRQMEILRLKKEKEEIIEKLNGLSEKFS